METTSEDWFTKLAPSWQANDQGYLGEVMSDDERHSTGRSRSNETTEKDIGLVEHGETDAQRNGSLKKKRAHLRGRITRSTNRINKFIGQGAEMRKRIEKEVVQIRKDFELAREYHAELYDYVDESRVSAMVNWEDILTNYLYDIEEKVENFLQSLSASKHANTTSKSSEQILEQAEANSSQTEAVSGNIEPSQETHEESPSQEPDVPEVHANGGDPSSTNSKIENHDHIPSSSIALPSDI